MTIFRQDMTICPDNMNTISEKEFAKICLDIRNEGDVIIKHNPIGTREETLLWMLMSVLISYLSVSEQEMPCFKGTPTEETYRQAIDDILKNRKEAGFRTKEYLAELIS